MAVMDFACAKGPFIVADGFDMFIVRACCYKWQYVILVGGKTLVG